jgi:prophage tail gpP-like protein
MLDLALIIGGARYGGWERARVQRSLDQVAGSFDLVLSERWPGQPQRHAIKRGAPCVVEVGGQPMITGHLDELSISYDAQSHTITARGRDKTADLVDCCHLGEECQWQDLNLREIAQRLCKPFGIEVLAEDEVGDPFPQVSYGQGDTVFSLLGRLARLRGLVATSDEYGRLVFAAAGRKRLPGVLRLGENIKAAQMRLSERERFSRYIVKGQGQTSGGVTDSLFGDDPQEAVSPQGEASDPGVARHRPLIILAEAAGDRASFERRARWEAITRAGRSQSVSYTVAGWGPGPGELWKPNRLVRVEDSYLGLDRDLLIERVEFSLDEEGAQSRLTLVPPEAYAPKPAPDQAKEITSPLDFAP